MKKGIHNSVKVLSTALLLAAMTVSCVDDKNNYSAGFEVLAVKSKVLYANSTSDSLYVQSLGPWQISPQAGAEWCTIKGMEGVGGTYYMLGIQIQKNQTGHERVARFAIYDTEHSEATVNWQLSQTATRGDGSLGNASLVKSIESSDGYIATIEYDQNDRPVKYVLMDAEDTQVDYLTISYDEHAGTISVNNKGSILTAQTDNSLQPLFMQNVTDTIGYSSQHYPNGMPVSYNYAFNFIAKGSRGMQAYSYLLAGERHPNGQNLSPDSLHMADSLCYVRQWNNDQTRVVEKLKLEYGADDNRCQSVDVNQLIFGFADYNPFALLSLYRYTRSTSIITAAKSNDGNIEVVTQLNSDKSVNTMTVKRGNKTVTYTFKY